MREHDLQPRRRRRYTAMTDSDHDEPLFPNKAPGMTLDGPNQLWVADMTLRWRALVEADISRFKRVIGDGLRSHTDRRRSTEIALAAAALNQMLELGRPEYIRPV